MSKETPDISDRVRAIKGELALEVSDRGVATGNDEVYAKGLPEAFQHFGAFETLGKRLPGILGKDVSNEEKAEQIMEVAYHNAEQAVRAVHEYDAEFFAGVSLAVGEAAQAYIAKHPDVNRVVGRVKTVGRNHMAAVYDQAYNRTTPVGKGEPAKVEAAYGRVNVSHSVYGNRKSAAQLQAVRAELTEAAVKLNKKLNK